jgi:hypothetical protein
MGFVNVRDAHTHTHTHNHQQADMHTYTNQPCCTHTHHTLDTHPPTHPPPHTPAAEEEAAPPGPRARSKARRTRAMPPGVHWRGPAWWCVFVCMCVCVCVCEEGRLRERVFGLTRRLGIFRKTTKDRQKNKNQQKTDRPRNPSVYLFLHRPPVAALAAWGAAAAAAAAARPRRRRGHAPFGGRGRGATPRVEAPPRRRRWRPPCVMCGVGVCWFVSFVVVVVVVVVGWRRGWVRSISWIGLHAVRWILDHALPTWHTQTHRARWIHISSTRAVSILLVINVPQGTLIVYIQACNMVRTPTPYRMRRSTCVSTRRSAARPRSATRRACVCICVPNNPANNHAEDRDLEKTSERVSCGIYEVIGGVVGGWVWGMNNPYAR